MLHGFGFAAVLREIGLPQTELATSLLFFNVGVEIGQIFFVLCLLGLAFILKKGWNQSRLLSRIRVPACYLIGTVACFWFLERIRSFWS